MVYGRYNELVFMGFINQQTSLGGTILYMWVFPSTSHHFPPDREDLLDDEQQYQLADTGQGYQRVPHRDRHRDSEMHGELNKNTRKTTASFEDLLGGLMVN